MFCTKCGKQISESTKFCPYCGADCSYSKDIVNQANNVFDKVEQELGSAFNEVKQSVGGSNNMHSNGNVRRLKDDRGLVSYILLTFITCGIYGYYFIYKLASDVNVACDGDGENTTGLAAFILLSIVTCGIYAWVWYYKLGNRLASNGPRYGVTITENGTTVLMWQIFGVLMCGIGPFIAMNILIKNSNKICNAYNRANGLV